MTKKKMLLELLEDRDRITIKEAAEKLYGGGPLAELKVTRLLGAYRAKDETFERIRIRSGTIVVM